MNIITKLTVQFTLIVATIVAIFSLGIHYFSSNYRENEFYSRLTDRANTTAKLLLTVQEVDSNLLKIIDKNTYALFQEHIYLYNPKKELIYTNLDEPVCLDSVLPMEKLSVKKIARFKDGEREGVAILYPYNSKDYLVIASAYDKYGLAKIKNLKIVLAIGFSIILFIILIAGLFYSKRALAPISTVVGQVQKITISNLNLRVDEGNKKDEIARLAITFNQMLNRLEEAVILQREFVSNAAHELRTPFSVLLAEIDYTLMQNRDSERYKHVLKNLYDELKKLNLLSNSLLDLARLNFEHSYQYFSQVRVDETLLDLRKDIIRLNPGYHIVMTFSEMPDDEKFLCVTGNEQLLKIAFKNLIENACKFSEDKTVHLTFHANSDGLKIEFSDNGIGIPEEDREKIFEPFYRGKNTQYISGFGMGLALTLKIINLHHGNINVESKINHGSVFRIFLPGSSS